MTSCKLVCIWKYTNVYNLFCHLVFTQWQLNSNQMYRERSSFEYTNKDYLDTSNKLNVDIDNIHGNLIILRNFYDCIFIFIYYKGLWNIKLPLLITQWNVIR
jgi:hypothetical protein